MSEIPREKSEEELEQEDLRLIQERHEELRKAVENGFGKDVLWQAEHTVEGFDKTIKMHLLEADNKKEAEKTLEVWGQFMDRTYQRLTSQNLQNPEMVEKVLKMATALVQPEATTEGQRDLKDGLKIIEARYGKIWK